VENIARRVDTLKVDGLIQLLKKEVEAVSNLTRCMDAFTNNHTRLVVIVDGLDSCEQDKLLHVLDMVSFPLTKLTVLLATACFCVYLCCSFISFKIVT